MSERVLELYKDEMYDLKHGDHVRFNATLMSMGDMHHLHHLHVFSIKKIPGKKTDLEVHTHSNGRYKFKSPEEQPEV